MTRKVALIGADGQLGQEVATAFECNGDEVCRLSHDRVEISDIDSIRKALTALQPQIVVNTAAFHNVEKCEADPTKAFAINAIGSRNMAQVAEETHAIIVHVSTDYVFDGAKGKPYLESDLPNPLNVYGNSKLAGEHFVRSMAARHFVLRTSAIYGKHACRAKGGLNFVDLMRKLASERKEVRVVDSEFVSPTPAKSIAQSIIKLCGCEAYGLYHATAEGFCSWYEFAAEIFRLTGATVKLMPAGPNEFPAKVARPKYSVLENCQLKKIGLNVFRPWQEGLSDYLM